MATNMNHAINLSRKLTQQLLHCAQINPDVEICGLIGANQQGYAQTCYPISNQAENPKNRFLLDATEQIDAMKQMRAQDETLFAIYHSHPHTAAIPSITDLKQASYPEAIHLIISLSTKGLLEMRAYQIDQHIAKELRLNLIDDSLSD